MTMWRRLPEFDGPVLAERYAAGRSVRQIAADTGLSYGTVWRRLSEHEVKFRPRGGYHPGGEAALRAGALAAPGTSLSRSSVSA